MPTGYPDYQSRVRIEYPLSAEDDILINIKNQDINEVTQRPRFGEVNFEQTTETVNANSTSTIISVSGVGMFYVGRVSVAAGADSQTCITNIALDHTTINFGLAFTEINEKGYGPNTPFQQLLKYSVDGECVQQITSPSGITFEDLIEVDVWNRTGSSLDFTGNVIYALIKRE